MALVNPHGGGNLNPRVLEGEELIAELQVARNYPKVKVSSREKGDIIMLGIGGFTPLDGFMTHADWQGVCDGMTMTNGLFWPIPITLSTDKKTAETISTGASVALVDPDDGSIDGVDNRLGNDQERRRGVGVAEHADPITLIEEERRLRRVAIGATALGDDVPGGAGDSAGSLVDHEVVPMEAAGHRRRCRERLDGSLVLRLAQCRQRVT